MRAIAGRVLARSVLAVMAGMLLAALMVGVVEMISGAIYPPPPGMSAADPAAMRAFIATLPAGAFVLVVAGWALGTLAGAWTAGRIAPRSPQLHAYFVSGLLLAAGVTNMLLLPHPVWVWIAGVIAFVVCGYAGGRLATPRRAAA